MTKFKILINGKNFKFEEVDGVYDSGFYTNVFVETENQEAAESMAVDILRKDEELSSITVNKSDNLPILTVLEIEILEKWPENTSMPRTRLEVYIED